MPPGAYHATVTVWGGGTLNREQNDVTLNVGMPLAAPWAVQIRSLSSDSLELTWKDNSSDENGFAVERAVNGAPFTASLRTGPEQTAVRLESPLSGTTYMYRVRAFRDSAYSGYSSLVNYTGRSPAAIMILSPRPNDILPAGDTVVSRWLCDRMIMAVLN